MKITDQNFLKSDAYLRLFFMKTLPEGLVCTYSFFHPNKV